MFFGVDSPSVRVEGGGNVGLRGEAMLPGITTPPAPGPGGAGGGGGGGGPGVPAVLEADLAESGAGALCAPSNCGFGGIGGVIWPVGGRVIGGVGGAGPLLISSRFGTGGRAFISPGGGGGTPITGTPPLRTAGPGVPSAPGAPSASGGGGLGVFPLKKIGGSRPPGGLCGTGCAPGPAVPGGGGYRGGGGWTPFGPDGGGGRARTPGGGRIGFCGMLGGSIGGRARTAVFADRPIGGGGGSAAYCSPVGPILDLCSSLSVSRLSIPVSFVCLERRIRLFFLRVGRESNIICSVQ